MLSVLIKINKQTRNRVRRNVWSGGYVYGMDCSEGFTVRV